MSRPVAVLGHAVHVPGLTAAEVLGRAPEGPVACSADEAHTVLGRRGLLYKEPATRLALCAAQRALGLPAGRPDRPERPDPRTGVVVSTNLGNLRTVVDMAERARKSSYKDVSPLEAPNASSNVVASTAAIRFGLAGPNVTLCDGATSGADAVRVAARLLRAGRADRIVVVGVEPDDEVGARLLGHPVRAAAVCVVLGLGGAGPELTGTGVRVPGATSAPPPPADLMLAPGEQLDLAAALGDTYGALGVLQVAAAAAWLADRPAGTTATAVCGDADDGAAWTALRAGGAG